MSEKLFCENCGEEENFRKKWHIRRLIECHGNCDETGMADDVPDDEDDAGDDADDEYESDEYTCGECEEEIDFMSENEILRTKVKHTDKEGDWSEEELKEDDWNEELASEYAAKQL